jgi:hypothetical protein
MDACGRKGSLPTSGAIKAFIWGTEKNPRNIKTAARKLSPSPHEYEAGALTTISRRPGRASAVLASQADIKTLKTYVMSMGERKPPVKTKYKNI